MESVRMLTTRGCLDFSADTFMKSWHPWPVLGMALYLEQNAGAGAHYSDGHESLTSEVGQKQRFQTMTQSEYQQYILWPPGKGDKRLKYSSPDKLNNLWVLNLGVSPMKRPPPDHLGTSFEALLTAIGNIK